MALGAECTALQPAMHLQHHVERYVYVDMRWPHALKPLSPRPESGIAFNLDCCEHLFISYAGGRVTAHPAVIVCGPLSHRIADIRSTGRYRAFIVLFKATGYFRLFGIPPMELADRVSDARDVIGPAITSVHEQLSSAKTLAAMADVVDRYLLTRLTVGNLHPVHRIAERLVSSGGHANLRRLAESSGLSTRQVERKFFEQIGITAKRYARLTRFRNAARLKVQDQALSWTDVSQATGYYDHTHLVKDFRELVRATPSEYLRSLAVAPATELWCNVEHRAER